MATLHSNSHWSPSSDALRQSSPPEGKKQLLYPLSYPLPPSFPASAAPPASFPASNDPAAEYGDDDIDDVLSDHNSESLDDCRNRAVASLQLQDKSEQKTRSSLEKKWLTVEISLYDGPIAESNYNHLDPSELAYS